MSCFDSFEGGVEECDVQQEGAMVYGAVYRQHAGSRGRRRVWPLARPLPLLSRPSRRPRACPFCETVSCQPHGLLGDFARVSASHRPCLLNIQADTSRKTSRSTPAPRVPAPLPQLPPLLPARPRPPRRQNTRISPFPTCAERLVSA